MHPAQMNNLSNMCTEKVACRIRKNAAAPRGGNLEPSDAPSGGFRGNDR